MLQFFQDEFIYRHTHFWNILMKLFILDAIIVLLPLVSEIMGISLKAIDHHFLFIFSGTRYSGSYCEL